MKNHNTACMYNYHRKCMCILLDGRTAALSARIFSPEFLPLGLIKVLCYTE